MEQTAPPPPRPHNHTFLFLSSDNMRFSASLFSGLLSIALLALLALPTAFASPLTAEQHAQLTALSSTERRELASALLAAHALNKARSAAEGLDLIEPRSSPTGDYAPGNVPCPPTNEADGPGHIRDARDHTISANETDYINRHRMGQQTNWMNWLQNTAKLDIPGGVQNYTNTLDNLPRVGIALSGGGYRAMVSWPSAAQARVG